MNPMHTLSESFLLAQDDDALIRWLTDAYLKRIGASLTTDAMSQLNAHQHTLLGYRFLSDEVNQGGFVQLIQNGYGAYLFDNPFAKLLKLYGAKELSKLVYRAKKHYDAHRIELERERTDAEFMAMYVDYEMFDELEEQYFFMEEEQQGVVAQYVRSHLADFLLSPLCGDRE